MKDPKGKDLIQVFEELSLALGHAKPEQGILEIRPNEKVMAEDVNEATPEVKNRHEREKAKECHEREEIKKNELLTA